MVQEGHVLRGKSLSRGREKEEARAPPRYLGRTAEGWSPPCWGGRGGRGAEGGGPLGVELWACEATTWRDQEGAPTAGWREKFGCLSGCPWIGEEEGVSP